ncbi:MAG TPA: DUF983 domain-containing protein [Bacteroidia bacterium]|nr:DUF983 domain-containing protein [Bacteroidia bacterium]
MEFRKTKMYSILNNKCPHCGQGNFFQTNNAYDLKRFSIMNKTCSHCQESFIKEPGYYFGAAYVSYALTVGLGIILYILLSVRLDIGVNAFLLIFSSLLIVLLPILFRISRLIWINIFVKRSANTFEKVS